MNRLLGMSLGVMLAVVGFAATGSAGETGAQAGQEDFDAVMERSQETQPMAPAYQNAPAESTYQRELDRQERLQYVPRNMEGSSGSIVGVITLVGDDMIRLTETDTGIAHEIIVSDAQEKQLTTGYAISAELRNGRLVSYQEMGIPQNVHDIVYSAENLPDVNVLEQPRAF